MAKVVDNLAQCPNCESFKTEYFSPRARALKSGAIFFLGGCVFTVFIITAIIGLPMILIGLGFFIYAIFAKNNDEHRCLNCNFRFFKLKVKKSTI